MQAFDDAPELFYMLRLTTGMFLLFYACPWIVFRILLHFLKDRA